MLRLEPARSIGQNRKRKVGKTKQRVQYIGSTFHSNHAE
uniref:Uncharacterized protein n=1 Tax=Arundo donax TaxID=35708 RepID=A0A0A8ZP58_ARUDO